MNSDHAGPVVEFLTFTVAPQDQQGWLEADERIWTAFLREQAGFISKQIWVDRANPDQVYTAITWATEAMWKSIPQAALAAVDDEFGDWRRPFVMRVLDVARST